MSHLFRYTTLDIACPPRGPCQEFLGQEKNPGIDLGPVLSWQEKNYAHSCNKSVLCKFVDNLK